MADGLDGPSWGPASGGKPRHLVLLLHGVGADGFDLIDLAPGWGKAVPDALFIAPHGPEPCDLAPYGRQWFSLQDRRPTLMQAGVQAAAESLGPAVEAKLRELGLTRRDLALAGFSQGAMTALHFGLHPPDGCAAVLAYSGALLAPPTQAGPGAAPVLLVHGAADEVVPEAGSRQAEAALLKAGFTVEAVYRPGLGHAIDEVGISLGALALQRALCGPA
ncbi:alpha/beta hydrolase [Falsiroseomonas tokyonensis]|uniref:Alpha/beta hydrolase n=1 Tax=Falsiroseomonas tokyonensis TaxID=430521 RepID=A0ABV7BRP2_9PROT|nr:alpha/beta hydrolase-fold protein [Falsiroseomonas tokyonensis]MBU8538298.1 dienelactone hydrolase family protein [Falsiroseomonas tokyonensis]